MLSSPDPTVKSIVDTLRRSLTLEESNNNDHEEMFLTKNDMLDARLSLSFAPSSNVVDDGGNVDDADASANSRSIAFGNGERDVAASTTVPVALPTATTISDNTHTLIPEQQVRDQHHTTGHDNSSNHSSNHSSSCSSLSLSLRYSQICASVNSLFSNNTNSDNCSRNSTTNNTPSFGNSNNRHRQYQHAKASNVNNINDNDECNIDDFDCHSSSSLSTITLTSRNNNNQHKDDTTATVTTTANNNALANTRSKNEELHSISSSSSSSSTIASSLTNHHHRHHHDIVPSISLLSTSGSRSSSSKISKSSSSKSSTLDKNIPRHELQSFLNVGRHLMQHQQQQEHQHQHQKYGQHTCYEHDNNMHNHSLNEISQEILNVIEPELYQYNNNDDNGDNGEHRTTMLDTTQLQKTILKLGFAAPIMEPPTLLPQEQHLLHNIMTTTATRTNTAIEKDTSQIQNGGGDGDTFGITNRPILATCNQQQQQQLEDYLVSLMFPKEFICPLCQDLIVGAVVLDCGCCTSTYCIPCFEKYQQVNEDVVAVDNDGFVLVDWNRKGEYYDTTVKKKNGKEFNHKYRHNGTRKSCPSCNGRYDHAIPCHAMNVAVLNTVKNSSVESVKIDEAHSSPSLQQHHQVFNGEFSSDDIEFIKAKYYARLEEWRKHFCQCQQYEMNREKHVLLKKFICEQEELIDDFKRKKEDKEKSLNFMNAEIPLVVAAFVGIHFIFRRWSVR